MAWSVEYRPKALKQLSKLDPGIARRITRMLEERIATHPNPKTLATELIGELRALHRFRVGDYRIICELREAELIILTLGIGHRKDVYERYSWGRPDAD